ncbi:hypothetical protein MXB_2884, partial [Myxobolus squamalis]
TFDAFKICQNEEIIPTLVFCTPACIEVWSMITQICVARYFYMDITSVQHIPGSMTGVAIKTNLNNRMEPVARLIGVSETTIVEHDPLTHSIVSVHPLRRIYSFYRSTTNPQEFGIEWNNGSKLISRYYCVERDALLATFLDAVRGYGN